jgi:putative membrane protein
MEHRIDQSERHGGSDAQLDLAQARTDLASERNLLAAERTYSAWVRTALTTIGVGFGVAHLLTSIRPRWAALAIGATFVVVGVLILLLSYPEYLAILRQREATGHSRTPAWLAGLLVGAVVLATLLGLVVVLLN